METKSVQQLKKEKWAILKPQIEKETGKKHKISVEGLDDDTNFFHPIVQINKDFYIKAQSNAEDKIENTPSYYALYIYKYRDEEYINRINIETKLDTFSEVLARVNKKKLPTTINNTHTEIETIKVTIANLQELITLKVELINKSFGGR